MRVEGFRAEADIVGRRVRVTWELVLEAGDRPAAPPLRLRRKLRDFEFPDAPTGRDPFLVYDGAVFPPAGGTVVEVELGERVSDDGLTRISAETVSRPIAGVPVEILRRTRAVTFDRDRTPVRVREEILDVHGRPEGLEPGATYYYELSGPALAGAGPDRLRDVATPTEVFRSGRMLYELMPAILRRHDVSRAPARATGAIPEAHPDSGQLRRYVDLFGAGMDHLRSRADGLRDLHDVDGVDHRLLPHLAAMVGWDLTHDAPIPVQRHEIRHAAQLYRITGTLPGSVIWVKRLTGWDVRIKEFWRDVFFTNDLGNPHDPTDRGSRTVDTADAAKLAAMGKFEDTVDYVYDTGTGPDDWYAYNVVGVFAPLEPGERAADVRRKRARLLAGAHLFLPFNLRAVVVLETDTVPVEADEVLGLTRTEAGDV